MGFVDRGFDFDRDCEAVLLKGKKRGVIYGEGRFDKETDKGREVCSAAVREVLERLAVLERE